MTDHDNRVQKIALGLGRIALASRGLAWRKATEEGVTPTQLEILQQIFDAPKALRLGQVAASLAISAPTASDAVSALVSKGLVVKLQGGDKRSLAVTLTPAGKKLVQRSSDWTHILEHALGNLSATEQAIWLSSLSRIIASLQDNGALAAQRLCLTCQHFRPFANYHLANFHHCSMIDRDFGNAGLRLNCAEHDEAEDALRNKNLSLFEPSPGT